MKNVTTVVGRGLVIICLAVISLGAQAQQGKNETLSGITNFSFQSMSDSKDGEVKMISMKKDGSMYKIRVVNGKIEEMFVDGKKLAESEFARYEELVKKIMIQVKKDEEQAEKDRQQAELDRQQAEKDRERAEQDRLQADKDREQAEKDRLNAEKDRLQANKNRENAEQDRLNAEKDRLQAEKDRSQAELDRKQAEKDRKQAEIDRKQAEEDRKLYAQLVDDLVKENIISGREDSFQLELSAAALVINGKEQPKTLHQKFLAKYLKNGKGTIQFSNSGHNRGLKVREN